MAEATGAVAAAAAAGAGAAAAAGAGAAAAAGVGAGAGAEARAEVAEPSGESQNAEVKTPQPTVKVGAPPRRDPRSVLKVSQLLLRALASHKVLTVAALKKELGNAGYQVRRKCCRHSGDAPKSDVRGALLRVSGSNASGCFRVWKTPKPRRKPGRPRLEGGGRSRRRTLAAARSPRRRRVRRRAAVKAREVWRRSVRADAAARRLKARAKSLVRSRAKAMDAARGRVVREGRPRSREDKKPKEEKKQEPGKAVKRTIQRSASVKTDPRAARAKTSTKFESPKSAAGNP
ncbi:testis-specific H1 histone [Molossus molossus]|uniref:testis-specific H1 histone n=1 Tax=Molossus molossus TaxID=27622 RepID=UPI001747D5A5|nr:testis-specific H1 histone [Molossus molossus]